MSGDDYEKPSGENTPLLSDEYAAPVTMCPADANAPRVMELQNSRNGEQPSAEKTHSVETSWMHLPSGEMEDFTTLEPVYERKFSSVRLQRVLFAWHVAGLAYFCVGGGPFGFEQSLEATRSPAISFWSLMLAGLLWALPQALLIGELSSIYELGYNDWVIRGLGQIIGLGHAWARAVCNITTNLTYCSLYLDYLLPLILGDDKGGRSYGQLLPWRLAGVVPYSALIICGNMLGVKIAGVGSVIFTIIVLSPIVVMIGFAFPDINWGSLVDFSVYTPSESSEVESHFKAITLLLSTLVFNLIGWDDLGNLASQVKKPSRDLPLGLMGCLIMILATYSLPLLAVTAVFTPAEYGPNLFVNTAEALWKPLGMILSIDAVIGVTGIGFVYMAASSEAQAHCSELGMLPKIVNRRRRNGVPFVAVIGQGLIISVLAVFIPFAQAVEMQSWLYTFSVFLIVISYVSLRWRWRHIIGKNPAVDQVTFRVPLPFPLICLMVFPVVCISVICLLVADVIQLVTSLVIVVLSFITSVSMFFFTRYKRRKEWEIVASPPLPRATAINTSSINTL
ncbi:Amino acid/polyamine transporter I [Pelomyxa schiedti]|nr:Amino acid/polyamine transporter I [Pelomyxa schiedti]